MRNSQGNRNTPRLVKHLPKWFNLKNYRGARDLDALGWWHQISVRRTCFAYVWEMQRAEPSVPVDLREPIKQALASLRKQPLCNVLSSPFSDTPFFRYISDLLPTSEGPVTAVRSMTLRDLCRIKKETQGQLSPEQIRAMRKYEGSDFPVFQFHGGSLNTPVPDAGIFLWRDLPLMIDLRYPNSVLIGHFKAYLQMLRKDPRGKPEEAAKHSPDLTKWASQGLLACMDLILWAQEEGCRMPDSRLVKALNPDPHDDFSADDGVDEESVRKTIRPLAKELLDWRTYPDVVLDRLRATASLDLTNKYGLES